MRNVLALTSVSGKPSSTVQDGLPTPQRYWSMLAIALGITLAALDSSVANIALPTIARQLHTTPAAAVWVVNAYQLVSVVALLPLASLGERVGYRRVYVAGLAVFVVGSMACALSGSLAMLVAARALQGLGAAAVMAVNGALVRYTFPLSRLGRGIGLNALIVSLATAIGPSSAAAILSAGSWTWLFAVNVPIGLINLALAANTLPNSERSTMRFDWLSAILNTITFGLMFIGVDNFTAGPGRFSFGVGEIIIALIAAFFLLRRAAHKALPLIPIDLMRIPIFALSVATSICSFTAFSLVFLAMPFFLQSIYGRSQVATGLLMTSWPAAVCLVVPLAGRLADQLPAAFLGSIGLAILAISLFVLANMPSDASDTLIACVMALCGLGFGFFQAPNNRTVLGSAPRIRAGAAGGMIAVSRLLGMTLGATIAATLFRLGGKSSERFDLFTAAAFALVGVVVSLSRLFTAQSETI